MVDVATITAVIAALGGPVLIVKAFDVYRATRSGKAAREKAENRTALGRLAAAEERAEREISFRLRIEVWAGRLEYMLAQLGVPADKIPTKPEPTPAPVNSRG